MNVDVIKTIIQHYPSSQKIIPLEETIQILSSAVVLVEHSEILFFRYHSIPYLERLAVAVVYLMLKPQKEGVESLIEKILFIEKLLSEVEGGVNTNFIHPTKKIFSGFEIDYFKQFIGRLLVEKTISPNISSTSISSNQKIEGGNYEFFAVTSEKATLSSFGMNHIPSSEYPIEYSLIFDGNVTHTSNEFLNKKFYERMDELVDSILTEKDESLVPIVYFLLANKFNTNTRIIKWIMTGITLTLNSLFYKFKNGVSELAQTSGIDFFREEIKSKMEYFDQPQDVIDDFSFSRKLEIINELIY